MRFKIVILNKYQYLCICYLHRRTFHATLKHKASGFCVHPLSGTPQEGTTAIMWMDACNEDRLKLDLFKLPG